MKTFSPALPTIAELSPAEAEQLLEIARRALNEAIETEQQWEPDLRQLPEALCAPGSSFVTLFTRGELHGCIGSVEYRRPLALDVAHNAVSAALRDPRFPPLTADELTETEIEVSVLTPMQPCPYRDLADLAAKVRPGIDGVLVERGWQRGLLLPQVWEKLPDPQQFLAHVALKANASVSIYRASGTTVHVFQVHHYSQPAPQRT